MRVLAALIFCLACTGAAADEVVWNQFMRAGEAAFKDRQYSAAATAFESALALTKSFDASDTRTAGTHNSLADAYRMQFRYSDAEPLYKKSLDLLESAAGPRHPLIALVAINRGQTYVSMRRFEDAEPLFLRAVSITEHTQGLDAPAVAAILHTHLAPLHVLQVRHADAQREYERSLAIVEKALGPEHSSAGIALRHLAVHYERMGRYADAIVLYRRALPIWEKSVGASSGEIGAMLNDVGRVNRFAGLVNDAEAAYKRSLTILEDAMGAKHPAVGVVLGEMAMLYEGQGRQQEADEYRQRSLDISNTFIPGRPSNPPPVVNQKLLRGSPPVQRGTR